ncbi:MarR family transcriptional regulator [Citricoccus sp. SGAir0253]|uniref:MarR family winged helix-turn-helix transcriptional regulator n=1 Tax=Citricoccus sp. SGAir0253 TaxID=2567881 RepID=UPI0010CD4B24|nr:MarR family transcriptional regulator [Citricoccus sp. SGAir0253]QCU78484.1 MarR family transcriptional regulator [Citricoccus sp. SGAir0253]
MTSSSVDAEAAGWSRSALPGRDPGDTHRRAWRAYFEATALLQDRLERTLKAETGLHLADYNLLLLLTESAEGHLRMGELASLMVFSPSRVTYQVKVLERQGLVLRRACSEDGRGSEAVITDAGRALFRKAAALHSRQVRELFLDRIDEEEAATLLAVFSRLGCSLEGTPRD